MKVKSNNLEEKDFKMAPQLLNLFSIFVVETVTSKLLIHKWSFTENKPRA